MSSDPITRAVHDAANRHDGLEEQLHALNAKLDYVVERQRFLEDLLTEMTPIAREAITVASANLQSFEDKGYFAMGAEVLRILDNVAEAYSPEDVRLLADNVVTIVDTVRSATQPEVLAVANEATEAVQNAGEVEPVGMFGALRTTRDRDVQRGMAVMLEVLRRIGRAAAEQTTTSLLSTRRPRPVAPKTPPPPKPVVEEPVPLPPPPEEPVLWEGVAFHPNGFLVDPSDWTPELGEKMAASLGIQLTGAHWQVLNWARQHYLDSGVSPNVRRVATGSGVGTKAMYDLFPKNPGKLTAMLAGIPKPVGCV